MKVRQRYSQYAVKAFKSLEELTVSLRQLVKQLNEQARDDTQIFNSLIEGELIAMDVTPNALPISMPSNLGTPRGVLCVYCEDLTDTTNFTIAPQVNWTYDSEATTVLLRALSGLTTDSTYRLVFLVLDGRARGDAQPIPEVTQ